MSGLVGEGVGIFIIFQNEWLSVSARGIRIKEGSRASATEEEVAPSFFLKVA